MNLKQVSSIILDGQNQIGKEQLLVCIEHHFSLGNSWTYYKCFHICDILTECCFNHVDFLVIVFVEFFSCYFVLISLKLLLIMSSDIISSIIVEVITSVVTSIQFLIICLLANCWSERIVFLFCIKSFFCHLTKIFS